MPPVLSEDDKDQRLRERSKEVLRLLVQTVRISRALLIRRKTDSLSAANGHLCKLLLSLCSLFGFENINGVLRSRPASLKKFPLLRPGRRAL